MKVSRYAEYVPVVLIIAGFLLVGLAWNGAAGLDYTQGQIPFLISGGLGGVALVMFGGASMIVRAIRKGQTEQAAQINKLLEVMSRTASTLTFGTNGHAAEGNEQLVVAGSSSFHLPTCRLVGNKESASAVPRSEAEASGLQPCRICKP